MVTQMLRTQPLERFRSQPASESLTCAICGAIGRPWLMFKGQDRWKRRHLCDGCNQAVLLNPPDRENPAGDLSGGTGVGPKSDQYRAKPSPKRY